MYYSPYKCDTNQCILKLHKVTYNKNLQKNEVFQESRKIEKVTFINVIFPKMDCQPKREKSEKT
jgi:hypothetical protein